MTNVFTKNNNLTLCFIIVDVLTPPQCKGSQRHSSGRFGVKETEESTEIAPQ